MLVGGSEDKNINKMRFIAPRSLNVVRIFIMYFFWRRNKKFHKCGTELLVCSLPRILQIVTNGNGSRIAPPNRTFSDNGNVHVDHVAPAPLKCGEHD